MFCKTAEKFTSEINDVFKTLKKKLNLAPHCTP